MHVSFRISSAICLPGLCFFVFVLKEPVDVGTIAVEWLEDRSLRGNPRGISWASQTGKNGIPRARQVFSEKGFEFILKTKI